MFESCSQLTSLDVSSFNTAKTDNMNAMFFGCSSLFFLKFGNNFDSDHVSNKKHMFGKCLALEKKVKRKID